MSGATYFVQECPTCGRRLQVRVEYLGRLVTCKHCNGEFQASDPALYGPKMADSSELLLRVNALLASADTRRSRPR